MSLQLGNADQTLGAAAANVVVALSGTSLTFLRVTITNMDGAAAHAVTVYRVANGGAATAANMVIDAYPIAPGDTVTLPLAGQTLVNGQSLMAMADVAAEVNINLAWAQTV